jgi:luciferase-like monooxygenase
MAGMASDDRDGWDDWDEFVDAMLKAGRASEGRSRYADKPALFSGAREIAHQEAPGVIDLRITRAGWAQVKERFAADPAVHRDPSRRDWIELHLHTPADLERLAELLAITTAANA